MNLLPIVQRELLVSAKSRRVFRIRMTVAAGATILGVLTVVGWNFRGGQRVGGDGLFGFLSFLFFLVCSLSGVFLTADCLSREKREGTLGLLFLTDLRGVDIIVGKLASTSLMTVLMVIGGLPVLAICVLLGGVSGGELFRTCAALLLTMLFSLSLGMFVSVFIRESGPARGVTLLLLLLTLIGIPVLTNLAGWLSQRVADGVFFLNYVSPAFLLGSAKITSGTAIPSRFLNAVAGHLVVSLALLAIASHLVRHAWQDRPHRSRGLLRHSGADHGRSAFRLNRDPLLDQNPILWLTGTGLWHGRLLALLFAISAVGVWFIFPNWHPEMLEILPLLNTYVLPYLLGVAIASAGAELFVRLRQRGALEFLLSTPLSDAEILRGQWLALRRRFLLPALVLLALIWIPGNSYLQLPTAPENSDGFQAEPLIRLYVTAKAVLLWFAAGWVGMQFGVTVRRPNLAGMLAIVVGVGLPWILWCVPEVLVTGVLINIGRETLRNRLREVVTRQMETGAVV